MPESSLHAAIVCFICCAIPNRKRHSRKPSKWAKRERACSQILGDVGAGTFKARYGLGLAFVGQDRYADAVAPLVKCLEEQEMMVDARYLLTIVYTRIDQPENAIRELETCLLHRPNFPEAEKELGNLYYRGEEL